MGNDRVEKTCMGDSIVGHQSCDDVGVHLDQLVLPLSWVPCLSAKAFYASQSNRQALRWIHDWPHWPFKTLFLYGPSGSGKTHLASIWSEIVGAFWPDQQLVEFPSAQEFFFQRKEMFYVLDGIDDWLRGPDQGLALFSLYQWCQENNRFLLLISKTPPMALSHCPRDLSSRLSQCPVIPLSLPDDDLLGRILEKRFADVNMMLPGHIKAFFLKHMERSFPMAQIIADGVQHYLLVYRSNFTLSVAKKVLQMICAEGRKFGH
jgi:chromosomal replication initiation ATPase DnaA